MHKSHKPVRKCHGCQLNFDDHCGVFEDPHQQWKSGKCKGHQNDALYQQYVAEQAKHPPKAAKEQRRQKAKLAQTEPHHDGTLAHKAPFIGRPNAKK
jgi:hypothetical protein